VFEHTFPQEVGGENQKRRGSLGAITTEGRAGEVVRNVSGFTFSPIYNIKRTGLSGCGGGVWGNYSTSYRRAVDAAQALWLSTSVKGRCLKER